MKQPGERREGEKGAGRSNVPIKKCAGCIRKNRERPRRGKIGGGGGDRKRSTPLIGEGSEGEEENVTLSERNTDLARRLSWLSTA